MVNCFASQFVKEIYLKTSINYKITTLLPFSHFYNNRVFHNICQQKSLDVSFYNAGKKSIILTNFKLTIILSSYQSFYEYTLSVSYRRIISYFVFVLCVLLELHTVIDLSFIPHRS